MAVNNNCLYYEIDIKKKENLNKVLSNLTLSILKENLSQDFHTIPKKLSKITDLNEMIRVFKEKVVLIIGANRENLKTLYRIRESLKENEYERVILKEMPDISFQSNKEKFLMYANICRFIVCDDLIDSGHISELELCHSNDLVTAIINKGKYGVTFMQADYQRTIDMSRFSYEHLKDLELIIKQVIDWAENILKTRENYFNRVYSYRS